MNPFWIRLVAALPLTDTAILIENGKATVKRGKLRSVLLSEISELAGTNKIQLACIMARTTPATFKLSFAGIPKDLQQRFLNVWSANWR